MHSQQFHDKEIVGTDLHLGSKADMQKHISSHIFSHIYIYPPIYISNVCINLFDPQVSGKLQKLFLAAEWYYSIIKTSFIFLQTIWNCTISIPSKRLSCSFGNMQ